MKNVSENIIIEFLQQQIPHVFAIYIYGSYANNTAHVNSDIDIAFLTQEKISAVQKWRIQEGLAAIVDKDVDLVDLKDASTVLRKEVVEKGKLIYSSDKYKTESFEMTTLSMYIDLNETRKHILNDYKEKYGRNSDK